MRPQPFISITISTFNRSEKIFSLVNNIIKYVGYDIEIIIFNNGSTDNTIELLNTINDSRVKVINNVMNIGGILGPLHAMLKSNAEYVFLCLDKDYIEPSNFGDIINTIKKYKNNNIVFGKCVCNLQNSSPEIFIDNQYDILSKLVYIAEHPTGLFFRTKELKSLNILNEINHIYSNFGFNSELIKAELSNLGNSLIINIPAFITEKIEDCKNIVSKTYNNKNLFFHPKIREIELCIYINSLNKLSLNPYLYQKLLLKIYANILYSATFDYKYLLRNVIICEHYSITTRKISLPKLFYYNFTITTKFLKQTLKTKYKFIIYIRIIYIQLKWFLNVLINSFYG